MAIRKISIGILVVLAIAGLLAGVWWFVLGGNKLSSTTPKPDDSTTTYPSRALSPAPPVAVRSHGSYRKAATMERASAVMSDARIVSINIYEKMSCKRL